MLSNCQLAMLVPLGMALMVSVPALAVTFGPLEKSGDTKSERKGFYLNLANPYQRAYAFRVYVDPQDEALSDRIRILPEQALLSGGGKRRILVIADDLTPGEEFTFNICAERVLEKMEAVHARVCSRLTARRSD